jgi:hypothetical protein
MTLTHLPSFLEWITVPPELHINLYLRGFICVFVVFCMVIMYESVL